MRVSPACAGNTSDQASSQLGHTGSAPRARGTRGIRRFRFGYPRVSPACAGNTISFAAAHRCQTGQPRVRGEHFETRISAASTIGSAPRARGTRWALQRKVDSLRVSPACAGNTTKPGSAGSGNPGQPRVRGEHTVLPSISSGRAGSAPRARGTRLEGRGADAGRRVSPACAGNTTGGRLDPAGWSGQPRVRGEHIEGAHITKGLQRVSPACAGNTLR